MLVHVFNELVYDKTINLTLRPSKIQISLDIRSVPSMSLLLLRTQAFHMWQTCQLLQVVDRHRSNCNISQEKAAYYFDLQNTPSQDYLDSRLIHTLIFFLLKGTMSMT